MSRVSNDGTRSDQLLIDKATAAVEKSYNVDRTKEVLVSIYGTASSASVTFSGVNGAGIETPKNGIDDGTFSILDTAGMNSNLRFIVSGLDLFNVSIDSVSGGNVSVLIREVS